MQQLLQMMQKISAEPNNNARKNAASINVPAKPATSDDVEAPVSNALQPAHPVKSGPSGSETLTPDQSDSVQPSGNETSQHLHPNAGSGEGTMVVNEDSTIADTVAVQPADNRMPEKGGVIKRWIKKAVSWLKRLIGY